MLLACASGGSRSKSTSDAQRYLRLGEVQFNQGKTLQAIESLKKAISLDPRQAEAEYLLGIVYLSASEYKSAQEHFKEAVRIDPYFTDAHNNLGVVYKEMKVYDRALDEFQTALKDKSYATPQKIYANMGHLYLAQGNSAEAMRSFQQAVAIKPDYLMGILGLGQAYQMSGRSDLAQKEFQRVVRLGPDSVEAGRARELLNGQVKQR
jgi:type IV pilus biogenesis/stability protein PilW